MYGAGEAIDIWVVERALGHGGMGSVYRCHNRDARRILAAIKVLDYGLKRSAKARARFVREAEILFSLDHPHIVKVRNVRLDADPPYLEMAFVEGGSLERRILGGPVPATEVMTWLKQLASALDYLHTRGIRHRDVKPSNVLVDPNGHVTLVDFGIATEADGGTLSESGQAMGSVAYVPPEWVHMGGLDPVRWDIYALGVCMFEALTGQTAFGVPSGGMSTQRFYQVLTAKQGHPPLDPGREQPFGLRELVRAMTHSDPAERLATASAVSAWLAGIDPTDIRPDHAFEAEGLPVSPGRRAVDTPRGSTMVPGGDSWENAAHSEGGAPAAAALAPAVSPPDAAAPTAPRPAPAAPPAAAPAPRPAAAEASHRQRRPLFGGKVIVAAVTASAGAAFLAVAVGSRFLQPAPAPAPAPPEALPAAPAPLPPPEVVPATAPPQPAAAVSPAVPVTPTPTVKPPAAAAPAPAVAAAPKPPVTAAPVEAVVGVKAAPTAGAPVTNSQLAAWLTAHPEWQRETAIAEGKADDKFLKGWTAATPTAGKESAPAVGATWALAKAYCSGRGGLADVDAAPLSWTESGSQPWVEYRQSEGRPRWRRDDGGVSDQLSTTESGVFIGFRCAR